MWETLGAEFTTMVNDSIRVEKLPRGMNRGMIVLLHKGGPQEELTNWGPVMLLNVSYKIVAKTLQKRIQPFMPEIIHEDQTGFLPMCYILDNVLLQHEVIEWSCESSQDILLFKLDFQKAYDTMSLSFLF
jgi:hypothetical protein